MGYLTIVIPQVPVECISIYNLRLVYCNIQFRRVKRCFGLSTINVVQQAEP